MPSHLGPTPRGIALAAVSGPAGCGRGDAPPPGEASRRLGGGSPQEFEGAGYRELVRSRQALDADIGAIRSKSGTPSPEKAAVRVTLARIARAGFRIDPRRLVTMENAMIRASTQGADIGTAPARFTLYDNFIVNPWGSSSRTSTAASKLQSAAYDALASAIVDSNLTAVDVAKIDANLSAVHDAEVALYGRALSSPTFPYLTLIMPAVPFGGVRRHFGPLGPQGGCGSIRGRST